VSTRGAFSLRLRPLPTWGVLSAHFARGEFMPTGDLSSNPGFKRVALMGMRLMLERVR